MASEQEPTTAPLDFIPANSFQGAKTSADGERYVFKKDLKGLGYYLDAKFLKRERSAEPSQGGVSTSGVQQKPAGIKPGGVVLAKNNSIVKGIKAQGGVKKPAAKDAKADEKKSAYAKAMEAYKSQACDTTNSDRPLVK